jgi:hypothetical protein
MVLLPAEWMLLQIVPVPLGQSNIQRRALKEALSCHVSVDLGYTLRGLGVIWALFH